MLKKFIDCDVVIQAGHENTPDDKTGGEGPLGKEIEWTPVVANEAVRILKDAGVHAVKETAHIKVTRQKYRCKLALFVHFDDPEQGESGHAHRRDGLDATLTAFCRRVEKDNVINVRQENYSYKGRQLQEATLLLNVKGIPAKPPTGFKATYIREVKATQFGKNDTQDEGTGSPIMGLIQTNSEIFWRISKGLNYGETIWLGVA
jgi:hypothetical protein